MTKTTGADARTDRPGAAAGDSVTRLLRAWPHALLTALLVGLLLPAAFLVAPGFVGPPPPPPAPPAPEWQQAPATPAARQGLPAPDATAPLPSRDALTAQVEPLLLADGEGTFTGIVQDAATGQVLFDRGGAASRVPASNMKLLTAIAALRTLGPDHRFETRVLAGPGAGQVVLAGGGDVLLGAGESDRDQVMGHAGLASLAAGTVDALAAAGTTGEVSVLVDDSLFTGPSLNPAWQEGDVAAGEVAPLFPLALNSARFAPDAPGPRPQDSAVATGEAFASALRTAGAAAGLTVAPGVERRPRTVSAPEAPETVLAAADSATVAEQVNLMLQTSDNYLAEVLGRMAAIAAGLPGSNDGATSAVRGQLADAGILQDATTLVDVCGLAMGNQVSARQFTDAVRAMTSGTDSRLREALDGFPVAGLTGTLDARYGDGGTAAGAGLVRAKTGTLNTVLALSGYVVDADGRLLVFSFIGNGLTPGAAGNRAALDRAATAVASCGCR
jgi:D-alanyl-D-alanine carboxypeptidase/D-alanyl-D-alanine-endopeptidase (penicillin-binding protein 4)